MIYELIDEITSKVIEDGLSDPNLNNYTGIIIKQNGVGRKIAIDSENYENIEDVNYIKERVFFCQYINSNKSVVSEPKKISVKLVTTANKYAIGFNSKTFWENQKGKVSKKGVDKREYLVKIIEEYLEGILKYTESSDEEKKLFLQNVDLILHALLDEENKPKDKRKVFLIMIEKGIDDYKCEFYKYFNIKILDDLSDGVGRLGLFSTLNAKKPLLGNIGTKAEDMTAYTLEEAFNLYSLKTYLDWNARTNNSFGQINFKFNAKDKDVTNYEINPYLIYNDKLNLSIVVKDLLRCEEDDVVLETYSEVINYINKFLDFSLGKDSKDPRKKMIYHRYKSIISDCWCVEKVFFYKIDKRLFVQKLQKIMNEIIEYNGENEFKRVQTLNLKLELERYFLNKEIGTMKKVKEHFIWMMENYEKEPDFESEEELMFAAGQLARKINNKCQSKNRCRMLCRYSKVKTYEGLIDVLTKNKEKYRHFASRKEDVLFALIQGNIKNGKISEEDKKWFAIGLDSINEIKNKKQANNNIIVGGENYEKE